MISINQETEAFKLLQERTEGYSTLEKVYSRWESDRITVHYQAYNEILHLGKRSDDPMEAVLDLLEKGA